MADQGFPNRSPLLIPVGRPGMQMHGVMKEHFKSCRTSIKRCFGILKSPYSSVGTRRFRNRRWIAPLICNVTAALFNRRKKMFATLKESFEGL